MRRISVESQRGSHAAMAEQAESKYVLQSPLPNITVPEVSLVDFAFETHKDLTQQQLEKPWIVNVPSGKKITFGQAKQNAQKIASALARLGFGKGEILFFVTTDSVDLYQVQLAVWMLGGAVRGTSAYETPESYVLQMTEVRAKYILVDAETEKNVKQAAGALSHGKLIFLSVGDQAVDGTTHISELLLDDGNGFPNNVQIDLQKDTLLVSNTSGSTGNPKGVMHTNYTYIASLLMMEHLKIPDSVMEFTITYGVVNVCLTMLALRQNITVYHLNKFDKADFMETLLKFKPSSMMVYPYTAAWFARHPLLKEVEQQNFLKHIMLGGWVLDPTTSELLSQILPRTHIQQVYGMSEILYAAATEIPATGVAKIPTIVRDGQTFTASGRILPNMEAKVLDMETNEVISPYEEGLVLIRTPAMMKGYLTPGSGTNQAGVDSEGWLTTGDVGFFDQAANLYLKERANFMFKYLSHIVAPSEIESALQEHPAVQAAGVVGVPNPETNNLSKALVVLKEGQRCTPEELCEFIKQKLPTYKHLHGGAVIVESLPLNKGGKLDRRALKVLAN